MLTNMVPLPTIKRLQSEEELFLCVNLLRAAFGTVAKEFGLTEENAPTNAAFTTLENLSRNLQDGMELYGLFQDSILVGSIAIKQAKGDEAVYYIERLAVAPERRHRGHGSQLLSFGIDRIRRKEGTTASIGLMDSNLRLKRWYQSKGFIQHDCRSIAHLPFKVCFMSLDLNVDGNH